MTMRFLPAALVSLACALTAASQPAFAQADWPTRPVRVLVPSGPGGTSDIFMRLLAGHVGKALGQPVVVENRPGAGGTVAASLAARAEPDGYTFMMNSVGTHGISPAMYKLSFDPDRDVAAVARLAATPNVLYVRKDSPIRTVRQLLDHARAHPGQVTYASSGQGTAGHLSAVRLAMSAGLDLVHVPYNGAAPAIQSVLQGQVTMAFENAAPLMGQIRGGTVVPLAVTSATRSTQLPQVPTMAEAGVPDFEITSWFGVVGPAGTPVKIVERFSTALQDALREPEVIAAIQRLGSDPSFAGPAEFDAFMKAERARWLPIVKASGATAK